VEGGSRCDVVGRIVNKVHGRISLDEDATPLAQDHNQIRSYSTHRETSLQSCRDGERDIRSVLQVHGHEQDRELSSFSRN